eukprot:gene10921-12742_t
MSFLTEMRNLADVLDPKSKTNPQALIRSLLNAFPDDFELDGTGNVLSDSTNKMNFDDDQDSGLLTPIHYDQSSQPSTPSLSLPDSFNVDIFENVVASKKVVAKAPRRSDARESNGDNCQRCSEIRSQFLDEQTVLNRKYTEVKTTLDTTLMKYDASHAELMRLQKISGINEENLRLEITALTDRCLRLTNLHESESALRRRYEERANKYDVAETELTKLRKEAAELRSTLGHQGKAVQILTTSENAARRAAEDAERVKDLLTLDKSYLQQENRAWQAKYEEKSRAVEAGQSQSLALELKVAQLTDQLLSLQLTARTGFDERMDKEIQRLRDDNAREMEALKLTSREILDRENRVLREAKTSTENELNQLRLRNDALTSQLSMAQQALLNTANDKNNVISELRAELKMKSFELTTLGVSFEERMGQLRASELEVDVLRQEVSAHKSALQRLEHEAGQDTRTLRLELDQATSRLRAYEALEEEIDSAVVRTAGLYGSTGADGLVDDNPDASAAAAAQRILQSVKGIPSNPERRVKQAVFLAQRLLETERARDALQVDLGKLRDEVKHAKKSAEIAQENLTRAAQPASYLVSKLRDEEGNKNAYLAKCNSLEAELVRTQKECTESRRECKALKERLQVLLQSRGELETVKEMIAQMGAHLAAEARDEESSDESDSDSESEHSEGESRQDTKGSSRSGRGSYGGSAEEKRQSLSPASSRHSSNSAGHSTPPPKALFNNVQAAAMALGLSPEKLELMTSPPKHTRETEDSTGANKHVTIYSPTHG